MTQWTFGSLIHIFALIHIVMSRPWCIYVEVRDTIDSKIYRYVCMSAHIHIYIYIERERIYQISSVQSPVTAPIIPGPRLRHQIQPFRVTTWSKRYQLWYSFATTLSASLQSLCYSVEKQIESSLQESDHTLPCPTL